MSTTTACTAMDATATPWLLLVAAAPPAPAHCAAWSSVRVLTGNVKGAVARPLGCTRAHHMAAKKLRHPPLPGQVQQRH